MNAHQKENHQSPAGMVARNSIEKRILQDADFDGITFSLLVSHAALRGYNLKKVSSGYTITSRDLMRHFIDISGVFMMLQKMGMKLQNQ